jgi:hypothetical protein
MKQHIYIAILLIGCLLAVPPVFAGNIYLTGHDLDFHCTNQPAPTQCNAFKIAVAQARAGAPDSTKPVLFVDQPNTSDSVVAGQQQTALAAANVGFVAGMDYVVVDPTTLDWTNASLSTATYSAILFASHSSCGLGAGSCDNTDSAVTAINARSADISTFFNSGGGLVYLAGATSTTYYNSVPTSVAVSSIGTTPGNPEGCLPSPGPGCYQLTALGTAIGLTNDDADCCFTHNSFSLPTGSPLQTAEVDGAMPTPNPETLLFTSGNQQPPSGSSSTAVLTFSPGTNVKNQAVFNSNDPDTTQKHSMKLTFANVSQTFTLAITATEVPAPTPAGVCNLDSSENANVGNPAQDCRLANFFGSTLPEYTSYPYLFPIGTASVNVPYCLPYSHGHCVDLFVQVVSPSNPRPWSGAIQFYIASNADVSTLFAATPPGYVNFPQLYDDPDNDQDAADYPSTPGFPYPDTNEDLQYVFNITTTYNPGAVAGQDFGVGGHGKTPNHFVVAFPLAPSTTYTYGWVSPFGKSTVASFKKGTTIPVKFTLSPNTPPGIAVQAPNHVGVAVVSTPSSSPGCTSTNIIGGTYQPFTSPGGSPKSFTYDPMKQQYGFNLTATYPVGTYDVLVNSNLFGQQCQPFTVTK